MFDRNRDNWTFHPVFGWQHKLAQGEQLPAPYLFTEGDGAGNHPLRPLGPLVDRVGDPINPHTTQVTQHLPAQYQLRKLGNLRRCEEGWTGPMALALDCKGAGWLNPEAVVYPTQDVQSRRVLRVIKDEGGFIIDLTLAVDQTFPRSGRLGPISERDVEEVIGNANPFGGRMMSLLSMIEDSPRPMMGAQQKQFWSEPVLAFIWR